MVLDRYEMTCVGPCLYVCVRVPPELDRRFLGVCQFEAKFYIEWLRFAPLRHYAYLLNVYFSDRTFPAIKYRILRHQRTRSRHIKCANSTPPVYTSKIIHLLVLTTSSEYLFILAGL